MLASPRFERRSREDARRSTSRATARMALLRRARPQRGAIGVEVSHLGKVEGSGSQSPCSWRCGRGRRGRLIAARQETTTDNPVADGVERLNTEARGGDERRLIVSMESVATKCSRVKKKKTQRAVPEGAHPPSDARGSLAVTGSCPRLEVAA
jgi:hypothetical protein